MKKGFGSIAFAYAVAVISSLSAIITAFFNGTDFTVSFKVVIFIIWLSITIILVLAKVIYDVRNTNNFRPYETPFEVIPQTEYAPTMLLIRVNEAFRNEIFVTCYYVGSDDIEKEAYIGTINHRHSTKNFQINIERAFPEFNNTQITHKVLKSIRVRPIVSVKFSELLTK